MNYKLNQNHKLFYKHCFFFLNCLGELDLPEMGAPLPVAVKVLKETASREIEEDFLREVDVMSTFRHENILALLGVVPRGIIYLSYLSL